MNNEEAIKTIKIAKAEVEWNYPMEYQEAFDIAIECIKKQIPKKPKIEYHKNRIKSEQIVYICPVCGDDFNDNEYEMDYCWNCGQAVLWSEVE